MSTLNEIIEKFHGIESILMENGGVLDDQIEKMLTENSKELADKLDGYAEFINYLKGVIAYLKAEAEQYTAKASSYANVIDGLRERMVFALQETGDNKLKTAKHSYSIRTTASWKINDDLISNIDLDELVNACIAQRTYKVDMKGLKDRYKDEFDLPEYIDVTEKQSINIR
jgi:hypothetical protein